jgi:hypothetical protein
MAIDYRKLNAACSHDNWSWPLPRIDDSIDKLGQTKARYFTSLELRSSYHQFEADEESRPKTAFVTNSHQYQYNVVSFGLTNAPQFFQRAIESLLTGLDYVLAYIDDILIYSETIHQHLKDITEVLSRLRMAGLMLKPSKCFFVRPEVKYLGFILSKDGLRPDPNKVKVVVKVSPGFSWLHRVMQLLPEIH